METLVAVNHHRNQHQYYGRNRNHGASKFGSFGSPSASFRAINCRTFQSGEGLLPTPFYDLSSKVPASDKPFSASLSPKTPTPSNDYPEKPSAKRIVKSRSVPVPIKCKLKSKQRDLYFSELWAGPAYSNSPPPSSLPIPKFSVRPTRSASLDLPNIASEFDLHPIARSAPASPRRERSPSPIDLFGADVDVATPIDLFGVDVDVANPIDLFDGINDATKTLRRILNLDISDD
ncbi:uncharacterized protein LOC127242898 [Andrographis paniculata]|uniref:uncharacterized protein LOC127242898 n=1 Tax=Andrographis paniculata TaxID=175694 RepID=UPI0021E77E55|nr:uncharacterized protein LOC127242898 [Andrographis paniculata]